MAVALASSPAVDRYDLSSLRNVLSGAAILGADLAIACERKLGCPVTQAYGMTEMSSVTHLAPLFEPMRKPDSIGLPVPGTECRLVDPDTGQDVAAGKAGELYLRGDHVMIGYLNNPEATASAIDSDGWLHTGDLAVVDDDGWFRVVARLKEIIKVQGLPGRSSRARGPAARAPPSRRLRCHRPTRRRGGRDPRRRHRGRQRPLRRLLEASP